MLHFSNLTPQHFLPTLTSFFSPTFLGGRSGCMYRPNHSLFLILLPLSTPQLDLEPYFFLLSSSPLLCPSCLSFPIYPPSALTASAICSTSLFKCHSFVGDLEFQPRCTHEASGLWSPLAAVLSAWMSSSLSNLIYPKPDFWFCPTLCLSYLFLLQPSPPW